MTQNNQPETTHPTPWATARRDFPVSRDFLISLCVLAFIVVFALCGLAANANWRKFTRVLIAFLTYNALLLAFYALIKTRLRSASTTATSHLPFWAFAVAACAAELASGWWRTNASASTVLTVAPVAAFLVGGIHWLALRSWRRLRERIVSADSVAPAGDVAPRRASS
jgi:hypothetical protein